MNSNNSRQFFKRTTVPWRLGSIVGLSDTILEEVVMNARVVCLNNLVPLMKLRMEFDPPVTEIIAQIKTVYN